MFFFLPFKFFIHYTHQPQFPLYPLLLLPLPPLNPSPIHSTWHIKLKQDCLDGSSPQPLASIYLKSLACLDERHTLCPGIQLFKESGMFRWGLQPKPPPLELPQSRLCLSTPTRESLPNGDFSQRYSRHGHRVFKLSPREQIQGFPVYLSRLLSGGLKSHQEHLYLLNLGFV